MSRPTVADLMAALDKVAPARLAETWDRVGLMVGRLANGLEGVLVALDATAETVTEARRQGCNALVTHHPLIFHPLESVDLSRMTGAVVAEAVTHGVSLLAAHTNLDSVRGGVNDVLAEKFGLRDLEVLRPVEPGSRDGLGRIGRLEEPLGFKELIGRIKDVLGTDGVMVAGRPDKIVRRMAVCGGSGGDLVETAWTAGADLLLAGEVAHHAARQAEFLGLAVAAAGHYATEAPVVPVLADRLREALAAAGLDVPVRCSTLQRGPLMII